MRKEKPADKTAVESLDAQPTDKDGTDAVGAPDGELSQPHDSDDALVNRARDQNATSAIVIALAMVFVLAGLVGWLGYRQHQSNQADSRQEIYVDTARQAAINLTSLSYTDIDADIKRIVDSAAGGFRDEFQKHSPAFVEAIKKVRSTSVGTVTEAGLQSMSGDDQAQVLVAVAVKTSSAVAPEQETRAWRMRISVTRDGQGAKVSDVQFVD